MHTMLCGSNDVIVSIDHLFYGCHFTQQVIISYGQSHTSGTAGNFHFTRTKAIGSHDRDKDLGTTLDLYTNLNKNIQS